MCVIVVGGGIGGLVVGFVFCKVGIDVYVYEWVFEIWEVGVGFSLWVNVVWVLEWFGVVCVVIDCGMVFWYVLMMND